MTALTIISYHPRYAEAASRLYEHAYAVPQTDEKSALAISQEVVQSQTRRESFIGVLAINAAQEVVGMAWGYDTPTQNTRMLQIVKKRMGPEWIENTFLVEVFAMHLAHRSDNLALALHDGLVKRVRDDGYERLRIRLDLPRLDGLHTLLPQHGWQSLSQLAHVMWLGKSL